MTNPLKRDLDEILAQTDRVWTALDGASIFVTGGTGFYGCWLLESFAWAVQHAGLRAQVQVLTRSPSAFAQKAPHLAKHRCIRVLQGDVRSFGFPKDGCTHLIHAATDAAAASSPAPETAEIIEQGTLRSLVYASSCGASRFLLASSGAVYGRQPPGLAAIAEDNSVLGPLTLYGEAKRVAETLALAAAATSALQPVIARGFAFVGPHQASGFAVSDFLRDGLTDGLIRVRGDGTALRSYLYGSELAVWLWHLLAFGESCRAYNVGSDREISIRELACAVREATGASDISFGALADPAAPPERFVPDVSRIRTELGMSQGIALAEAIRRTVSWLRPRISPGAPL